MRKSTPRKSRYRISEAQSRDFDRFGCSLHEKSGVLYIDWRGKDSGQAARAAVFTRFVFLYTALGPIVLLVLEISPIRTLPRYSYFPFDLRQQVHKDYLSSLVSTGAIKLRFVMDTESFNLTHSFPPQQRLGLPKVHSDVLQSWKTYSGDKYDFEGVLQAVERELRMPVLAERVLLEELLPEITARINEAALAASSENRELARRIVDEAGNAFSPYYENKGDELFENFARARRGLGYMIDLRRLFADNTGNLAEFLSDGLAGALSRKELEGLSKLLELLLSLFKLPFREQVTEQISAPSEAVPSSIPDVPGELVSLVKLMGSSGISKDLPRKVFELLGLETGGKPGRPPKDYSRAYTLKALGYTWPETSRTLLQEDPELSEEFGGHEYDSLDIRQKDALEHRIREGARSYAERKGKPWPIEGGQSTSGRKGADKPTRISAPQKIVPDKLPR